MEAIEKVELAQRTRLRHASLLTSLDWGGLMAPLSAQQTAENLLAGAAIESPMAVSDENWDIKSYQRDRTYGLNQIEVAQERQIAIDKVATGKAKLAIQRTTDAYTLAVLQYKAAVQALLMGAKEFAAQVELEQLAVVADEASLAVQKEAVHLQDVTNKIYIEHIAGLMVQADVAKYQVEVAKANVQAILADIAAGEADIKVIETQIQGYMAQADKATLQADVAIIFARILTYKLNAVKLDVGQKEIAAGFGYVQSHLDDALARLATQQAEESLRIDFTGSALSEEKKIFPDEKASEDLREQETLNAQDVLDYQVVQTAENIDQETALKQTAVVAQENLLEANFQKRYKHDDKETWAKQLIDQAKRGVYSSSTHTTIEDTKSQTTGVNLTRNNEFISAS